MLSEGTQAHTLRCIYVLLLLMIIGQKKWEMRCSHQEGASCRRLLGAACTDTAANMRHTQSITAMVPDRA